MRAEVVQVVFHWHGHDGSRVAGRPVDLSKLACVMHGWDVTARTGQQLDEATVAAISAFTIDTGLAKEVLVYVTRRDILGNGPGFLLLYVDCCLLFGAQ